MGYDYNLQVCCTCAAFLLGGLIGYHTTLLLINVITPKFEEDAIFYPLLNGNVIHLTHLTCQLKRYRVTHANAGMIEVGINLFR